MFFENLFSTISDMGFFGVLLLLAIISIIIGIEMIIGYGLYYVLDKISNKKIRFLITFLFWIVFFPCMAGYEHATNVTEGEKRSAPFSYTLRAKSKALIWANVFYFLCIYFLFFRK